VANPACRPAADHAAAGITRDFCGLPSFRIGSKLIRITLKAVEEFESKKLAPKK
jgi:hypothetical protein